MIENSKDYNEIKKLTAILVPEVTKALNSVNLLIQDVMEIGNNKIPEKEITYPVEIILESIQDIFKIYDNSNIRFRYDFKHTHCIHVESAKILRVISNIIENAIQSMKEKGDLYFSTEDFFSDNKMFVKFSIKNTGSTIAEGDLPKLFEPYFTKHKKGGTGLGLAIAKKVVDDHGGIIWCESKLNETYPDGYVELIFTLPAHEDKDKKDSIYKSSLNL